MNQKSKIQIMDSQKQQLIEKLNGANNILVTVSSNPSVDQLAACIGLTVMLDEVGKRGVAVYSGETPSTIEFLKPKATIEKTTDSLRDFIIAFSKAKADKLRYKVEDDIVRIYVTPYKTALSDKDLEFSQGDFNIDAIVALGVKKQEELDQVVTAHGRILHDATIITVNNTPGGDLGAVNWVDESASSLCELVAGLASSFEKYKMDEQVATALLTGIVAETNRFSNEKTKATTMTASAALIAAGANQQLVATELSKSAEPAVEPALAVTPDTNQPAEAAPEAPKEDGSLQFTHDDQKKPAEPEAQNLSQDTTPRNPDGSEISIDNEGTLRKVQDELLAKANNTNSEAPIFTAAGQSEAKQEEGNTVNPLVQTDDAGHEPLLSHNNTTQPAAKSLADLESEVQQKQAEAEVQSAENSNPNQPLPPITALNAQPLGDQLHNEPSPGVTPADKAMDMPLPPVAPASPDSNPKPEESKKDDTDTPGTPPPPVPPPMVPPFPQA